MGSRSPGKEVLQRAIARNFDRSRRDASTIGAVAALCAVLGLSASPSVDAGNTYFVNSTGDSGTGTLRQAIADASNAGAGNTVMFDAGLVGSTITLTSGFITIDKPMAIKGPGANLLTISGGNHSRIFYVNTDVLNQSTSIEDLTLTAGDAGAIHVGGAILIQDSSVYLSDSAVTGSTAGGGGGIFASHSFLYVASSRVSGNTAGTTGGGISANYSTLYIGSSTISGNTAAIYGGGIYDRNVVPGKTLNINRSTISGNRIPQPASPGFVGGGGLALKSVSVPVVLAGSTVAANYSYLNGGIALLDNVTPDNFKVRYSTIASNSSATTGGNGISTVGVGTVAVVGTIISGNFSASGLTDLQGTFQLTNCLVRNVDNVVITMTSTGNLFGVDPHLSALADHGGPTLTLLPSADSAAVDAVVCSAGYEQRGFTRCVNGLMDIGAVERQNPEDIIFRNGLDPI